MYIYTYSRDSETAPDYGMVEDESCEIACTLPQSHPDYVPGAARTLRSAIWAQRTLKGGSTHMDTTQDCAAVLFMNGATHVQLDYMCSDKHVTMWRDDDGHHVTDGYGITRTFQYGDMARNHAEGCAGYSTIQYTWRDASPMYRPEPEPETVPDDYVGRCKHGTPSDDLCEACYREAYAPAVYIVSIQATNPSTGTVSSLYVAAVKSSRPELLQEWAERMREPLAMMHGASIAHTAVRVFPTYLSAGALRQSGIPCTF